MLISPAFGILKNGKKQGFHERFEQIQFYLKYD